MRRPGLSRRSCVRCPRPGHLLRRRVDLDRPGELANGRQHFARHLTHRPVRGQWHGAPPPVGAFDDRLVGVKVERHDEGARAVGRGQRRRFPAPRSQPQRRMLELRLGRRQRRRELAQHLCMSVEGVEGLAPVFVVNRGPRAAKRHRSTVALVIEHAKRATTGRATPPAGFEPATLGLEVRRSVR
jgi:hypothetical protein